MHQCWTKSLQASIARRKHVPKNHGHHSFQRKQSDFLVTRNNSIHLRRLASSGTCIDSQNFAQQKKEEFQQRLKNAPFFLKGREGTNTAMRSAAVLVPFCMINGLPSLLFTLRSSKLLHYKRDVSFPGGMKDLKDKDLIETALREAEEELGILKHQVDIWGCINPIGSRHNDTAVTPVVGFLNLDSTERLTISTDEVECAFTRSLQSLCDPKNCYSTQYRTRKGFTLPVYMGGDFRIWGLTAVMLHIALRLVVPEAYSFELYHIKS